MDVFPVLDLKAGQVVQAVAGRRNRYRPIESVLTRSADPYEVARALVDQVGCLTAYVADLDAIEGSRFDRAAIDAVASAGMQLIVDAGIGSVEQAESLAAIRAGGDHLGGVVVGLESLNDLADLPAIFSAIGTQRSVFSLDLMAGRPLSRRESIQSAQPEVIAEAAWSAGFRRLIVLDLAIVGTDRGPRTLKLCRLLRKRHAWAQLISGGGVRNTRDLRALQHAGCDATLIASALHRGTLRAEQLAELSR